MIYNLIDGYFYAHIPGKICSSHMNNIHERQFFAHVLHKRKMEHLPVTYVPGGLLLNALSLSLMHTPRPTHSKP